MLTRRRRRHCGWGVEAEVGEVLIGGNTKSEGGLDGEVVEVNSARETKDTLRYCVIFFKNNNKYSRG